MLVLSRKLGEQVVLPTCGVTITVVKVAKNGVRLGISAPPDVPVHREETWRRIVESKRACRSRNGSAARAVRVLIAHEDQSLTDSYRRFLVQEGFQVRTVTNGLDCLEELRQGVQDVLAVQHDLPRGGGGGVLAVMREQSDVPSVPALLLPPAQPAGGLGEGAGPLGGCNGSPWRPDQLAKRIRQLASPSGLRRPASPAARLEGDLHQLLRRSIVERTGGRIRSLHVETAGGRIIVQGQAASYHVRQLVHAAVVEVLTGTRNGRADAVDFDVEVAAG